MKSSRYGDGYELMLKSGTGIKESPKKIDVPVLMEEKMAGVPKSVRVDGISRMEVFQKVTIAGKRKQDIIWWCNASSLILE